MASLGPSALTQLPNSQIPKSRPSPSLPLSSPCQPAGPRPAWPAAGLILGPRLEPELAFGDDRLSRLEAFLDDHVFADALADGDRLLVHGVALDEEHELAVLSRLYGLVRQHQRVGNRRDAHAHARELAGPQPTVAVRKPAFEFDRVGRRIDGVVDEREGAFDRRGRAGLRRDRHRNLRLAG